MTAAAQLLKQFRLDKTRHSPISTIRYISFDVLLGSFKRSIIGQQGQNKEWASYAMMGIEFTVFF